MLSEKLLVLIEKYILAWYLLSPRISSEWRHKSYKVQEQRFQILMRCEMTLV